MACNACKMRFSQPEEQRSHYHTDLHRFNLKRQVAGLPPLSPNSFARKVEDAKAQLSGNQVSEAFKCDACNKSYGAEKALQQHLASKKHKQQLIAIADGTIQPKMPKNGAGKGLGLNPLANNQADSDEEEDEIEMSEEMLADKKIAAGVTIPLDTCMFCRLKFGNLEKCLDHMLKTHGFFIPDIEYLTSLEGLISYLSKKISIGNSCIYCNRPFATLEAVQAHMRSVNHCKILYEEDNADDYDEFYNFDEAEEEDAEEASKPEKTSTSLIAVDSQSVNDGQVEFCNDGLVMKIGGKVATHRSLQVYANQKFRPAETRESVLINVLMKEYQTLGVVNNYTRRSKFSERSKIDHKIFSKQDMRLGIKENALYIKRGRTGAEY